MDTAEEEAATPPGGSPVPSTSRRGRGKQADQLPEVDEELSSGRQRSRQSRTRGASENESEAKPSRASSKPVEVKAEVSKGRSKRGQKLEALNASVLAAEPDKPTVEKRSKAPVPKVEEEPKVEVAAPAASVGRRGRASALKAAAVVEPVSSTAVTASSPAPRRGRVSARQVEDQPAAEDKPQPGRGRKASASSLKEEATPVSGKKARGSSGPLEAAAPDPGRKGKRSVEAEIEEEEDTPIAAKRGRTSKSIPVAKETQTPAAAKPSSPAKPSRQRGSRSRTNEVEEQPTPDPESEPLAELSKGRGRRSAKSSEASQSSAPTKKSAAATDASASKSVNARRKRNLSIVDETKGDETSPEKKSKVEAPPTTSKPSKGRGKKSVAAVDEEAADADNDVSVASTTSSGPRGRRGSTKDVAKVEELGSSRRSRASEKTRGVADKSVNDVKKVTLESAVL